MELTVLGSGTLLPDDARRSPAHWLDAGGAQLLLDCGSGALHGFARHRVPWQRLTHLALTHFHTDHVSDLAGVLFALRHGIRPPRELPLVVIGPRGTQGFLERLAAAHGTFVTAPGFPLEVVELWEGGRWDDPDGRFTLLAHPTPHTDASLAYRVESAEGGVGYTGDTGPSDDVADFLAGVAVLLAECSLDDPPSMDTHLSPATLAHMATRAAPGLLVVTHTYPPLRPHRVPRLLRAAGYAGDVLRARDGTRVEIRGGRPRLLEG